MIIIVTCSLLLFVTDPSSSVRALFCSQHNVANGRVIGMSAEPSPTVIWEDVGPWHGDNNSLKLWRRGRKPLGAAGDASIADGNPPSVNNNKNGSGKYLESVVGAFSSSLSWLRPRPAAANTEESRISPSGTRGREEREGGECRMPAEPCTADEQVRASLRKDGCSQTDEFDFCSILDRDLKDKRTISR